MRRRRIIKQSSSSMDSDRSKTSLEEALQAWQRIPSILQGLATTSHDTPSWQKTHVVHVLQDAQTAMVRSASRMGKAAQTRIRNNNNMAGMITTTRNRPNNKQDKDDHVPPSPGTTETAATTVVPAVTTTVKKVWKDDKDWSFYMVASSSSSSSSSSSAAVLLVVVALASTYTHYAKGTAVVVPWNLFVPWLAVSMCLGYLLGYYQRAGEMRQVMSQSGSTTSVPPSHTQMVEQTMRQAHYQISTKGKYTPPLALSTANKKKNILRRVLDPVGKLGHFPSWRRRRPVEEVDVNDSAPWKVSAITMENQDMSPLLQIPMPVSSVTTLDEYTTKLQSSNHRHHDPSIENLGMDLFFNGGEPVSHVTDHPTFLATIRQKAPILVINGMTHVANVILYFQLPAWVTSWSDLQKSSDDGDNVEARILRQFLLGTDEYRDERLVIVPQIVDAPLPVKMIAPKKAEILVKASYVPSSWYRSQDNNDNDNEQLCPALELELDLIANATIRSVVGIVTRHLHRISLDVACLIYDQDKKISVCLTCFCFDHIDMTTCPSFPEAPPTNDYDAESQPALDGKARASPVDTEPALQMVEPVASS